MRSFATIGFIFLARVIIAQPINTLGEFEVIDSVVVQMDAGWHLSISNLQEPTPRTDLNMTQLLARESAMNFKDYGPGLLSTPTFRGGDANHTQVLWNGMAINSPMLGVIDFSTLPISQFTSLDVFSSSSSNLYNSGGIGGVVSLNQKGSYVDRSARAAYNLGSFQNQQATMAVNLPFTLLSRSSFLAVSADRQDCSNQFVYTDISDTLFEQKVMQDAEFDRANLSAEFRSFLTSTIEISAVYWWSETNRNIPAAINSAPSISTQYDRSHRAIIGLSHYGSKLGLTSKLFYENQVNDFIDDRIGEEGKNHFDQWQHQVEANWRTNERVSLSFRNTLRFVRARSLSYESTAETWSDNAVLFARIVPFERHWLEIETGYRFEQFIETTGLLPFGGVTLRPSKTVPVVTSLSASQTMRLPTLNELFWLPGGNPELQPEQANTVEWGLKYEHERLEPQVTLFYSDVQNRIRWVPTGQWSTPVNIYESEVLGVDVALKGRGQIGANQLGFRLNGQMIQTRMHDSGGETYALSYIPEYSGNATINWIRNSHSIELNYQYVGQRFITSDESGYLPAYQIVSIGMMEKVRLSNELDLYASFWVNNVLDWEYQSMPWRPMPGRAFSIKLDMRWLGGE